MQRRPSLGDNPFQLGIASGDPDEHGFVIWTRLAPKPFEGGGMPLNAVAVQWEVAEDEKFSKIVRKGESIALPQLAHSVHVEVEGLQAGRWYWYRFMIGNEISPVGRARTMPALEETPEQLRFAFASCQHWESGYYTAYQHMTNEDLDLVIHLGDYIYEGSTGKGGVREHIGTEIQTLADYRTRHAQYKTDTHLQAVHAQFPWLVTWDDHELDNNCAGDISEEKDVESRAFLARRANAYQAYYEHMPLRRRSIPAGPNMELFDECDSASLLNSMFSTLGNIEPISRTEMVQGNSMAVYSIRKQRCSGSAKGTGFFRACSSLRHNGMFSPNRS